jgi:riboflavin synthase
MFTGLVETLGVVRSVHPRETGADLVVDAPAIAAALTVGESVSVNGACLTVVRQDSDTFLFQVGPETLARTNLGSLVPGDRINLEQALRPSDRMGGHFVQGHVDGVGQIIKRSREGEWEMVWFGCTADLALQMVPKGSVAVDGISLTLVDVKTDRFSVALIPHTLEKTTLGFKTVGAMVNLETDLLAKYVWKCLRAGGVTMETLRQAGFLDGPGPLARQ